MATNTTNYSLKKPEMADTWTELVTDIGDNATTIDSVMKGLSVTHCKWAETKTISSGNNSLTVSGDMHNNDILIVMDANYGFMWLKGVHFTVLSKTFTFDETFDENMTFYIINLDKGV